LTTVRFGVLLRADPPSGACNSIHYDVDRAFAHHLIGEITTFRCWDALSLWCLNHPPSVSRVPNMVSLVPGGHNRPVRCTGVLGLRCRLKDLVWSTVKC